MRQQQPGQPDPKEFASSYAGQVAKVIQEAQNERAEKYPLFSGRDGLTVEDHAQYYSGGA